MAKIYTGHSDEKIIDQIISKGLGVKGLHKWVSLRLALALSLKISEFPGQEWEKIEDRSEGGSEYSFEQLTGERQEDDYTDVFCAILCAYYEEDLFSDPELYRKYMQRHVRRGLHEIRTSWKEGHDFHSFLAYDLFSDGPDRPVASSEPDDSIDLASVLPEIGVTGKIQNEIEGVRLSRYLVYLENLQDLERLEKNVDKLAFSLGKDTGSLVLSRTNEPRLIGIDIPRKKSSWKKIDINFSGLGSDPDKGHLPVCPGVDIMGAPFIFDLVKTPHLLIGGTTGSGKSACIHALILSLLTSSNAQSLQLCFIDAKRVEFNDYNDLDNFLYQPVISELEDVTNTLGELRMEMEKREKLFAAQKVRNIDEYHASGAQSLPRIIVFVDELADLVLRSPDIETQLVFLAQKARSSGIHLVLATQRPDAKTFTGLLRSNIPSRIALTVQKASESKIILDETGAEGLTGDGDMIVKLSGQKTVRVHGYHVKQSHIEEAVRTLKRK